jgi:hypothetical protein
MEGSIGFATGNVNFFTADFHVLGLFIPKKHDFSKKNPSVTRRRKTKFESSYSLQSV